MAKLHPWLSLLSEATPDRAKWGGKATGLWHLQQANLQIPPTVVLTVDAFAHLVATPVAAIHARTLSSVHDWAAWAAAMGQQIDDVVIPDELQVGLQDAIVQCERRTESAVARERRPLAVRSSACWEDGSDSAAPGLFASVLPVAPNDVWSAIRSVWHSACTPIAMQYRQLRGLSLPAMAVMIQPVVAGTSSVVYTRSFADLDSVVIEQSGHRQMLHRSSSDPRVVAAIAAETAIGCMSAEHGADVEMIIGSVGQHGDSESPSITIVQARPIVQSALLRAPQGEVLTRREPPTSLLQPLASDSRTWTLDLQHNPEPLSVAQAALVDLIEHHQAAPYAMKLCAGYLYSAGAAVAPAIGMFTIDDSTVSTLQARWAALATEVEIALALPGDSLALASNAYVAFYRIWANQVAPLIKLVRRHVQQELQRREMSIAEQSQWLSGIRRNTSIEHWLQQAAQGAITEQQLRSRIGNASAHWDVAMPTFAEQWDQVMYTVHILRSRLKGLDAERIVRTQEPPERNELLALVQLYAGWAEQDDLWFFAAQALIRRALLRLAVDLSVSAADVFWIPWHQLQNPDIDSHRLRAIAAGHLAAHQRASKWSMPRSLGLDANLIDQASKAVGHGPRFVGRVMKLEDASQVQLTEHSSSVIVARSLTPGLVLRIVGAAGVVCDTGGLLDHGAAMARELGVPYLVGAGSVFDRCYTGQEILVDPQTGACTLGEA